MLVLARVAEEQAQLLCNEKKQGERGDGEDHLSAVAAPAWQLHAAFLQRVAVLSNHDLGHD